MKLFEYASRVRVIGFGLSFPVAVVLAVVVAFAPRPAGACPGDCTGDNKVGASELVIGLRIALGEIPMSTCPYFDRDGDGKLSIDEIVAAVAVAIQGECPAPTITTVVGSGLAGFNGDGMGGLATALYLPQDVTVGPDGNLYLADWNNHRIRRLKDGKVETIAGTGELGDAKDGTAIYVQFNHPTNVNFDGEGRLLIAAWHNSLVKRLDFTTGLVENIAGTGARAFGGDYGPANDAKLDLPSSVVVDSRGNIIISDQANYRIRSVNSNKIINTICGDGTPGYIGDNDMAVTARLNSPKGQAAPPAGRIAIDQFDRIYIADTNNHVIRMIDIDGRIHTVVGTGEPGFGGDGFSADQAQLDTPSDVDVGRNGALYIADTNNNAVRMVDTHGIITTIAGTTERGFGGDGEPANQAQLDRPYGVAVAPNGDIFVADTHNQRIRQIEYVVGTPPPTPAPTPTPKIIDCTDEVGSICTYAGTGETGFTSDGLNRLRTALYWPFDIEFTSRGRRIVLDWNNHKVREILPDDTFQTIVGTDFVGDGPPDPDGPGPLPYPDLTLAGADWFTVDLNHPTDIQEFPNGDILFVAWHNHKLRQIDATTGKVRVDLGRGPGFAGDNGPAKDALANQPAHAVFDPDGNLFFIDQRNQRIRVIYQFGAVDPDERWNQMVTTVAGTGDKGFNGDGIARETKLSFPTGGNPEPTGGIARDEAGNIYFSDTENHRIRRIEFSTSDFLTGVISTIAGTGQPAYSGDDGPAQDAELNRPGDIEIGPDGNIYFADTNNNVVRKIDLTSGKISTIAGTGEKGYSGDGGPAREAMLDRPFGVAFDQAGDLYISDTFNSRVRKVKLTE